MYFSNVVRNKTWIAEIMLCVGIIGLNHHVFATPQINDPNAVAQQIDAFLNNGTVYSQPQQEYTLPDWLADFNDPDVGPGVPYMPSIEDNSQKFLSWDLIPPKESEPQEVSSNSNSGEVFEINQVVETTTYQPRTTYAATQKPTTKITRTTTKIPKTIASTTTSTTTNTPTPTTMRPKTINSFNGVSSEIYTLPGGNSEILPSWLEGFDDPELSVGVPFIVPEDNNEYNHTLTRNILPPLEPFEDLKMLSISGFITNSVQPVTEKVTLAAVPTKNSLSFGRTSSKPLSTTLKPFQQQLLTKQNTNSPTFTQEPILSASPNNYKETFNSTTNVSSINRIPQLTLKSSAQATGFTLSSLRATQPTVKTSVQPVFDKLFNSFFHSRTDQNGFSSLQKQKTTTTAPKTFETTTSWLSDTNYVNLSRGVPFSLQRTQASSAEQTIDGVTIQKSISSELSPFNFIHNFIPSQSNVPNNQAFILTSTSSSILEPSKLFTPPIVIQDKDENWNKDGNLQLQTTPINNNNFETPIELSTKPSSKLTFTKNDQGKVISRNVFEPGQYSTNPVLTPPSKNDFGSSTLTPDFSTQLTTPIANVAGKYTGGFGGAPGILVGQSKPALNLHSEITTPRAITTPIPKKVFTGSFGGPPGILTPYDNV